MRCKADTSDGKVSLYSEVRKFILVNATKVIFTQQPTDTVLEYIITPAVTVQLQNASSNNVAQNDVPIVIAKTTGTGVLSGVLIKLTDVLGLAVFNDLSINAITSKNLTASCDALTPAISNSFNIYGFMKNGQGISLAQAAPVLSLQIL